MRQNIYTWLIGILLIAIIAGYVDLSNSVLGRDTQPKLGLDLRGGLQLVLQAQPRGNQGTVSSVQLEAARNIIEDRANSTGASEPVVQTAGSDRILVELPGISNLEDATALIKETGFLEYINSNTTPLAVGTLVTTSEGAPTSEQIRGSSGSVTAPTTITTTGTVTGTTATTVPPVPTPPSQVYQTIITGDDIDGSKVSVQRDQAGLPYVAFTLKGNGAKKLADFTTTHVSNATTTYYMPIVLDKRVISSPSIQGAIIGGNGQINGMPIAEAQKLATQLRYGSLPVSLQLLESRKISATLGQDAINKSLVAGIVGLGLVMLFMMVYYRLPGLLASLALLLYSVIVYAVFKLVPVTLTLAGIAGFILSIGMAVDANVLIFSRLKEELRSGKTLGAAVEAGFDHAWPSIRDSNMSTLITCAILFWFGSTFGGASTIKGFALTLAIGVIVSLFSAITVTRTFLRATVNTPLGKSKWAFHADEKRPTAPPAPTPVTEP
ncbi:MAG: protein translocase subunit SecD [Chloroflexi bacterium]|nr:protein translocase subunit SecD [Chloroflexota bacterium]